MQFNIKSSTLINVVNGVSAHVAPAKVNRPNLHGIQFEVFNDGTLTLAGTDTFTLAIADIHIDYVTDVSAPDGGVSERAVVNAHDLVSALKQFKSKDPEDWVNVRVSDGLMTISNKMIVAALNLMPDQFPRYRTSLPASNEFNASVSTMLLNPERLARLNRCLPTSKNCDAVFKLRFKGDDQPMIFERSDFDVAWTIYLMPTPVKVAK